MGNGSKKRFFGLDSIHSGQTVTETAILVMLLVFAFLAMQTYLKRAVQGHLKSNIDQVGSQYDFGATSSDYTTRHVSNVTTTSTAKIQAVRVPGASTTSTIDRTVTTSLSTTHYDNTTRSGIETVAKP